MLKRCISLIVLLVCCLLSNEAHAYSRNCHYAMSCDCTQIAGLPGTPTCSYTFWVKSSGWSVRSQERADNECMDECKKSATLPDIMDRLRKQCKDYGPLLQNQTCQYNGGMPFCVMD